MEVVRIGDKITLTPLLDNYVDSKLRYKVKNFDIIVRLHPNLSNWDGIKKLKKYGKYNKVLRNQIIKLCEESGIPFTIEENSNDHSIKTIFPSARDYQIKCLETIFKYRYGIIKLPTGSGKTFIVSMLVENLNKTLFITDRKILNKQTIEEFRSLNTKSIGVLQGKNQEDGDCIVTTIQTLRRKIKNDSSYLKQFDGIIVDECHIAFSKSFKFLESLSNDFIIGLSATPPIEKDRQIELSNRLGTVIFEDDSITDEWLTRPEITFFDIEEDYYRGSYDDLIEQLIENKDRNKKIASLVDRNKTTLILCDRIKHEEYLAILIPDAYVINGNTSNEERNEIIDKAKNGEKITIIGTTSIFQKGFNLPQLEVLINASAGKSYVKCIQSIGRVMRKHDNLKKFVYDFNDKFDILRRQTLCRIKYLRKEGHEIIFK